MAATGQSPQPRRPEYMSSDLNARLFVLLRQPPNNRTRNVVANLLAAGEDAKWRGDYGETYLHLLPSCAVLGSAIVGQDDVDRSSSGIDRAIDFLLPVVYQLVAAGLNAATAVDKYGNTPLHICVVTGAGHRMARALLRVGVDPKRSNCHGETAASLANNVLDCSSSASKAAAVARSILGVLDEAGPGLWSAVMDGNEPLARRLVQCRYRVDLYRNGRTMIAAAREKSVPIELLQHIDIGAAAVRFAHAALAGDVATVREMLNYAAERPELPVPDPDVRDPGYRLDDGSPVPPREGGWPLIAEVVRLGLREVSFVLVETGNVDINALLYVDGRGRPVPLFQWSIGQVLDNYAAINERPPLSNLDQLIRKADLSLIVDHADFVYGLYRRRADIQRTRESGHQRPTSDQPLGAVDVILGAVASRQVSLLSHRDADGRTARDLILLHAILVDGARHQCDDISAESDDDIDRIARKETSHDRPTSSGWKTSVRYVDVLVAEAVRRQSIDKLETLAFDGYDYINIDDDLEESSIDGNGHVTRSMLQMARDEHLTASIKFLEELPELQKKARRLHRAIARGHLSAVRENVDSRAMRVRDLFGRRALHLAVLYERRPVIYELLRNFPDVVNLTDYKNRTALHYAHCLRYGDDVVNCLVETGADTQLADQDGRIPGYYSSDPMRKKLIRDVERSLQPPSSNDSFLVERYLSISDAISSGRCQRVRELCDTLLDAEEHNLMSPTSCSLMADLVERRLVGYRPLLFQCVDRGLEDVAVDLVQFGADYDIDSYPKAGSTNEEPETLLDAANNKFMYKLVECIKAQMARDGRKVRPKTVSKEVVLVVSDPPASDIVGADDDDTSGAASGRSTNLSFSIYNLRSTSPSSGASNSPTRRSSSPICLLL